MFGCICPGNQIKKRCDKIFSTVNHNPCIGKLFVILLMSFSCLVNHANRYELMTG